MIGNESVDVMNYLLLAAVVNEMNYQPRPVIQGFVAYTPALQSLNEEYFRSAGRPHFVMLCQQATDGRFPTLEDSAALNYVLNNYVPVARDGRFLILQQRTAEDPAFQLVHEENLHFGEKLDLRPWAQGPLFMSVAIAPSLLGRAATFLYQQHPLYMRVARGQAEERYRIVPSMAERPFLVNPLLNSNYDVMNLYASHPGKEPESVTFERPRQGSFEFRDHLTVRLYTAPAFLRAAQGDFGSPHARRCAGPRFLAGAEIGGKRGPGAGDDFSRNSCLDGARSQHGRGGNPGECIVVLGLLWHPRGSIHRRWQDAGCGDLHCSTGSVRPTPIGA